MGGGGAPQDIKKNVIGLRIDEKVGNYWSRLYSLIIMLTSGFFSEPLIIIKHTIYMAHVISKQCVQINICFF